MARSPRPRSRPPPTTPAPAKPAGRSSMSRRAGTDRRASSRLAFGSRSRTWLARTTGVRRCDGCRSECAGMCRAYSGTVYSHPALASFDWWMRLDSRVRFFWCVRSRQTELTLPATRTIRSRSSRPRAPAVRPAECSLADWPRWLPPGDRRQLARNSRDARHGHPRVREQSCSSAAGGQQPQIHLWRQRRLQST